MIAWRRNASDRTKDEAFGLTFGAKATDATVEAEVNLSKLVNAGWGGEEVVIEVQGLPVPTATILPNGSTGHTVQSILDYLNGVTSAGTSGTANFLSVVDYTMERQQVWAMDICLGEVGLNSGMTDPEWACVYDTMTELVENRDNSGGRESMAAAFERHRLALENYLPGGRLRFNTLTQDLCPVDHDGDPDLEVSGPCQEATLESFVTLYSECQESSKEMLEDCRNAKLGDVNICDDFQASCQFPSIELMDGTVVSCDDSGLNAALSQVVPYVVLPPAGQPNPGAQFGPPTVLTFTDTPLREIPNTSNSLCGLTGVRGWLHESEVMLNPVSGGNWEVMVTSAIPDPDKKVRVDVTCVSYDNFTFINGVSSFQPALMESVTFPDLNGGAVPASSFLSNSGEPSLLGWSGYLSEPQTLLQAKGPSPTGFGTFESRDVFPFASATAHVGVVTVLANAAGSGETGGTPIFPYQDEIPMMTAGTVYTDRSTARVSFPLLSLDQGFCYLTSISGKFYNVSDSVWIDNSDGFGTLRTVTPLQRDRNPGAQAQCLTYDQL
ncbi:MAG: hypothetical protein Q8N23_23325 [Archangium sp.]|nr:hypothetical protein [Archangium sp.]MDP3570771.1 hypothetical protein [Archangium sp.]